MTVRTAVARAGLVAAVVAGITGLAGPALAAEGDGIIQNGEVVAWRDCDFTGPFYDFATDHRSYTGLSFPAADDEPRVPVDNNISSLANLSTVNSVNAYFFARFTGPRWVVLPGQRFDLCAASPAPAGFDDQLSSHHF